MFDLNSSIKLWRESLKAQPEIRATDLDELEDHLREEFEVLRSKGLSDEESFLISSRRLGSAEDLSGEFAIADPQRRRNFRLSWMISGALALAFLWLAAEVMSNFSTGIFGSIQGTNTPAQGMIGFGWIAGLIRISTLGIGGFFVWRMLATDRSSRRLRNMSGATVIGLSLMLALLALMARVASKMFVARALVKDDFLDVAVTSTYINWLVMLILPIFLLFGLWRLIRA